MKRFKVFFLIIIVAIFTSFSAQSLKIYQFVQDSYWEEVDSEKRLWQSNDLIHKTSQDSYTFPSRLFLNISSAPHRLSPFFLPCYIDLPPPALIL